MELISLVAVAGHSTSNLICAVEKKALHGVYQLFRSTKPLLAVGIRQSPRVPGPHIVCNFSCTTVHFFQAQLASAKLPRHTGRSRLSRLSWRRLL
jgi:hypothetical protein